MDLSKLTREELEANYQKIYTEKSKIENAYAQIYVELEAAKMKLNWYEEQIRIHQQKRFGASSEKTETDGQVSLFNEPENDRVMFLPEPKEDEVIVPKKKRYGHKKEITKQFPVQTIEYKLTEEEKICEKCGNGLHEMSKQVHVQLKLIPAQIIKEEHIQYVYSCRHCQENEIETPIVTAPMPCPVIRNSLASPSLISHIITRKYVEGLPLYRQEQQFKRDGIKLTRQTLSNWTINVTNNYLKHIYNRMHEIIVEKDILHADETEVEVLNEPGREAIQKSYMWMYRTGQYDDTPMVLFDYQPGRNGEYAKDFLKGYKGYLHVDGYAGYNKVPDVTLVGCFAHARRKYDEALTAITDKTSKSHTEASKGLEFCNALFKIEEKLSELTPEEKYTKRLESSKPILDAYFAWVEKTSSEALPKSALGLAVNYSLNQKDKLEKYLKDGRLEISNNRGERAIRPFVIGRGNWLFCNTPNGAQTSAMLYSIVETGKENNLNLFKYLEYLLEKLPNIDVKDKKELDKLLPWSTELPAACRVVDG